MMVSGMRMSKRSPKPQSETISAGRASRSIRESWRTVPNLLRAHAAASGLAFCRWRVEANNGRIYSRNLPDKRCVFTVDLLRLPVPAAAMV